MKELPISFSPGMVKAICEGRKTQTRRVVKTEKSKYGKPGDYLWVREAHAFADDNSVLYRANYPEDYRLAVKWRPPMFMFRAHSRMLLRVTDIRQEPLSSITEADAKAEGAMYHDGRGINHSGWRHTYHHPVFEDARSSFFYLWKEIHGEEHLLSNPVVWVVSFEVAPCG